MTTHLSQMFGFGIGQMKQQLSPKRWPPSFKEKRPTWVAKDFSLSSMKASMEPTPPNLSSEKPRKNRRQSWTSHTSKEEGNQIIKSHIVTHSIFTSIPMLYPAPAVAHIPQFLHRQRVRRRYFFTLHRGCKLDSKCVADRNSKKRKAWNSSARWTASMAQNSHRDCLRHCCKWRSFWSPFSNCGPAKARFLTTQRASKAQYDFGCLFLLLATAWQH